MRRTIVTLAMLSIWIASLFAAGPASATGTWTWPVVGPVVRGFDPPSSPYGSGHRGIDIATPVGSVVRAPAAGVVSFAGTIAGQRYLTIDHGGGLLSTCSFLSGLLVHKGDLVTQEEAVALSGGGHPGDAISSLHLGIRLDGQYVDPLDYLGPASLVDLIRLAPLTLG